MDDIVESARPPKPPRPYDAERRSSLLLHTIAVAAVATAVFAGITAWETHRDRVNTETVYCSFYTSTAEPAPEEQQLADQLGC